jgi:hypothetical protein
VFDTDDGRADPTTGVHLKQLLQEQRIPIAVH